MDTPYLASTSSDAMRDYILMLYADAIAAAARLREWMLAPVGYRHGTFRSRFRPFYTAFVQLYQATCAISVIEGYEPLKARIDLWIKKTEGVESMNPQMQDNRSQIGLHLFSKWSEALASQRVIDLK